MTAVAIQGRNDPLTKIATRPVFAQRRAGARSVHLGGGRRGWGWRRMSGPGG